jgi:hypothetical protein
MTSVFPYFNQTDFVLLWHLVDDYLRFGTMTELLERISVPYPAVSDASLYQSSLLGRSQNSNQNFQQSF